MPTRSPRKPAKKPAARPAARSAGSAKAKPAKARTGRQQPRPPARRAGAAASRDSIGANGVAHLNGKPGHAPVPFTLPGMPEGDRPLIHINGKLVPKNQAAVSVFDHGLLYGDGCFEGIRVYRGKIFKCMQHMKRLWKCAEALRINIHISMDEMVRIQRECIEANNLVEGYIRLVVTRGVGNLGLNPFTCPTPGIICIADQIRLYPAEMYETGMKVIVAKRPKTPIACLDPRIKSLNYLNNILAKVESIDAGCLEAIMLSTDGWVTECTGDNLFIVKNGKVYTPPSDVGLLEGVTRKFVRDELCPTVGVKCEEKMMRIEEVLTADEVFLTGTAAEMIAVTQIDDTVIGGKSEGPITKRLRQQFRKVVTSDPIPED